MACHIRNDVFLSFILLLFHRFPPSTFHIPSQSSGVFSSDWLERACTQRLLLPLLGHQTHLGWCGVKQRWLEFAIGMHVGNHVTTRTRTGGTSLIEHICIPRAHTRTTLLTPAFKEDPTKIK
ncbi:hypothetical protein IE53DRAFT_265362 [Violaceomyces palustris]|uniref:Uncharacterized protein n=1 Tax=Violaceomyces palustris TaxID=1673888 RepID=A0ACD0P3J5_9BASI|nr:hypothetical protein IE53DRAFT_265362 [Violaceomyces palustris]